MRACIRAGAWALLGLSVYATVGRADEPLKPEQVRKMYDDALVQLKAAQDRKAELAKENDSLSAKVEDLKKQLAVAQDQIQGMKRQIEDHEEQTYYLRSYQAAWQGFIRRHPDVKAAWNFYLGQSVISVPEEAPDVAGPDWPLSFTG